MSDVDQIFCRIAARAAAGEALGDDDGLWLADVLSQVRAGIAFDAAIGRAPGWQEHDARKRLRLAMGKIADLVDLSGKPSRRADAVLAQRRRGERTWRNCDLHQHPGPADQTSLDYWVFEMLRAAAVLKNTGRFKPIPDSTKQITRILEELNH